MDFAIKKTDFRRGSTVPYRESPANLHLKQRIIPYDRLPSTALSVSGKKGFGVSFVGHDTVSAATQHPRGSYSFVCFYYATNRQILSSAFLEKMLHIRQKSLGKV
jgi:hypothetical protein